MKKNERSGRQAAWMPVVGSEWVYPMQNEKQGIKSGCAEMARKVAKMETEKLWRVSGNVPEKVNNEIVTWANELGMTKTSLISLCIQVGLRTLTRTIAPEKVLTGEQWAVILEQAHNIGIDTDKLVSERGADGK